MPIAAVEGKKYSDVFKQELWIDTAYCREVGTANESAATSYVVGDVLGKVTATGKLKRCVQTASDGSQNAYAVVINPTSVSASTDTKTLVAFRGPIAVLKSGLTLDSTFDTDVKKQEVYDALTAKGYQVLESL